MGTWLSSIAPDDRLVICTITRGEILFGLEMLAAGRRRTELEEKARKLFVVLPCEPFPSAAADRYANVRLRNSAVAFRWMRNDLWMAATALAMNATLVSRDTDFQTVEGLVLVEP